MAKFRGIIAIDLTAKGEHEYPCNGADRLWLAKQVVQGGAVVANPTDCVLGIRIGDRQNDQMPWSAQDGYMVSFSGHFDSIFVTVLTKGATNVAYLNTGTGVSAQYGSTDGVSPLVGAGASTPPRNT